MSEETENEAAIKLVREQCEKDYKANLVQVKKDHSVAVNDLTVSFKKRRDDDKKAKLEAEAAIAPAKAEVKRLKSEVESLNVSLNNALNKGKSDD